VEKECRHETAAAKRSRIEVRIGIPAETQREILIALFVLTVKFLHMAFGFRRNPDTWQVFQGKKCKKRAIPY
jgi:hypothetical protein